jgi:hypothetical protein
MSLRRLNGVAYSIAHKFAASAEFFIGLAVSHTVSRGEADLLTISVRPADFAIERNLNLLCLCRESLLTQMRRFPAVRLVRAHLVLELDPAAAEHKPDGTLSVPVRITALIEDDRGSPWSGTVESRALGVV